MPSDIDQNGNYPICDSGLDVVSTFVADECKTFDILWKNHYQYMHPIPELPKLQQDQIKAVMFHVYEDLLITVAKLEVPMQRVIQKSSNEAYQSAKEDVIQHIKTYIEQL